ncbi:hypothetical protein JL721_11341 [Aureococcus anophagefferens]|nr:hypothetical protein JL721_11341 [Aureococcus anophagefferens]
MSRPGRDFDSDYDVEDDEEPSSAESDDSYDPEMPSTPKARRRPAAPPRGRGRSGGAAASRRRLPRVLRAALMRAAAAGGASRCPMCRAAFPAVVSDALDRGAAGAAAAAETRRGLRAGDGVQVRWEVEGPGGAARLEWYDATLVRHLGAHGHVGLAVAEVPERFLSARGFVLAYKDEPGERHVMLASDGLSSTRPGPPCTGAPRPGPAAAAASSPTTTTTTLL